MSLWVPFNMAFKTNLVTDAADEILNVPYHLVSPASFDTIHAAIPMAVGSVAYAIYIFLNFTNAITKEYIVRMSYSKDKVQSVFIIGVSVCEAR